MPTSAQDVGSETLTRTVMGDLNLFDISVAVIILLSGYFAYVRGAVREIMSVAGWIISAIAAYFLAPQAVPIVDRLPVIGEYLAGSCEISIIASFSIMFALSLIICAAVTGLLTRAVNAHGIGIVDRGTGLVFGVLRGILVVAVILILHDSIMSGSQKFPSVVDSRSAVIFQDLQQRIIELLPSNAASRLSLIYKNVVAICAVTEEVVPAVPPLPAAST